jgi:hypothetical protein
MKKLRRKVKLIVFGTVSREWCHGKHPACSEFGYDAHWLTLNYLFLRKIYGFNNWVIRQKLKFIYTDTWWVINFATSISMFNKTCTKIEIGLIIEDILWVCNSCDCCELCYDIGSSSNTKMFNYLLYIIFSW